MGIGGGGGGGVSSGYVLRGSKLGVSGTRIVLCR